MQKVVALLALAVGIAARTNAADSLNCRLVGSCILEGTRTGIALSGNLAYVSGGYGSLWILDVADPAAPHVVGRFDTTKYSHDVAVSGNLAYMVAYGDFDGFWIIDVSDPQEPYAVGRYYSACGIEHIVLSGDYAYLPAEDHGLRIVDVSEPLKPREVGYWDGPLSTMDVALSGNLAYVAQNDSDLYVVDVSKPLAPYAVGHCSLPGFALRVAVSGDFAYVAGFDVAGKLWVIDVSNPQEPYQVGGAFFPGTAKGVAVSGDFVYVVSRQGLYVIDVSDPPNPHLAGWYATECGGIVMSGGLAYTPGLDIFEFLGEGVEETPNAEVRTTKCLPAVVRGVLLLPGRSSSSPSTSFLIDASGRKVLDLSPGANDVRALAPGVYFVRGEGRGTADEGRIHKVVITR
jgi:hypothetical protein